MIGIKLMNVNANIFNVSVSSEPTVPYKIMLLLLLLLLLSLLLLLLLLLGRNACPQCMRCGLLLQMPHEAWSVCLCVGDRRELCINGSID